MKTIIFFLFLIVPTLGIGQCHPEYIGFLKSEVHGDSVVLRDDTTLRECNSHCNMQIQWLTNDSLVWMQKETVAGVNCLCHFNLSVTLDSLKPGNYIAKVYYWRLNYTDSCYLGIIRFRIIEPLVLFSPSIVDQYTSSCFAVPVGTPPEIELPGKSLTVFPNPTQGILNISTKLPGSKTITISDLDNKHIYDFVTDKDEVTLDLSHLSRNIYFLTVRNKEKYLHSKVMKY